jgi:hypothetical protein
VQAAALFGLLNVVALVLLIPRTQLRRLQWSVLLIGLGLGLIFWQADTTSQWMSRQIYARVLPR